MRGVQSKTAPSTGDGWATLVEFRLGSGLPDHRAQGSARSGCKLHLQIHALCSGCFGQHPVRLAIKTIVLYAGQRSE